MVILAKDVWPWAVSSDHELGDFLNRRMTCFRKQYANILFAPDNSLAESLMRLNKVNFNQFGLDEDHAKIFFLHLIEEGRVEDAIFKITTDSPEVAAFAVGYHYGWQERGTVND